MKSKRDFLFTAAMASLLGLAHPVITAAAPPAGGEKYKKLPNPVPTASDAIEVLEFFWYGCPHCNEFEPLLADWEKNKGKTIALRRVPIAFREDFVIHQKLFYALEALGKLPEMHVKVFRSMHQEGNRLMSVEAVAAFAEKNGLDKKSFMDAFNSFGVASKAAQASQLARAYRIDGVPTLGVDGLYTTSATLAGGTHSAALAVADELIDMRRQARKGQKR
jgi:thiol:disulfide interchange protein DsbA